jgi:hypothetical protein
VYIQSRADSDDINDIMAMVMIAMMIVLVMVNIVPEALNQVDSVCQHLCKTFQQLIDFLGLMYCVENSTPHDVCISQLQLSSIMLLCSHQADSEGGYKPGHKQNIKQASDQALIRCSNASRLSSGLHTAITAM